MLVKKIIALICLMVLCVQVIPLRQIGGLLFNNQITEEMAHTSDCGKKSTVEKDGDHFLPAFIHHLSENITAAGAQTASAHPLLVIQHIGEVQTPPPNLV